MTDHVKIYGVKPRIQYTADGILNTYDFPFAIFSASDIDVYLGDEKQDDSTYSVSGVRSSNGGSVTLSSTPLSGTVITIVRNLSIERSSDFQEGGALRADVLNDELDYQIACQQQLAENLNRSMVLPPYATDNDLDLTLPTPSAGKAIVWNADGTNLENSTVAVNALESTLNGYKTAAQAAAATATDKASVATTQAQTATTQAGIATTKADEAAASVNQVNGMRSNCVTEMAQDINLELNNGVLTLKAGSKVYIPNGAGQFDTYVVPSDLSTTTPSSSGTAGWFLVMAPDKSITRTVTTNLVYSGETAPSSAPYMFWYDTTNNLVKYTTDSGATWTGGYSLPLAIVSGNSGFKSIDQVFNGFGYMGSTLFALPGVKCLIPNGKNSDGTLKSISYTIPSVLTKEKNLTGQQIPFFIYNNGIEIADNLSYHEENNIIAPGGYCQVGWVSLASGVVTGFAKKSTFRSIDCHDLSVGGQYRCVIESYKNSTSWYRIYSDGWVEQGGVCLVPETSAQTNGYIDVTLLIPMNDTNYSTFACGVKTSSFYANCENFVENVSKTTIRVGRYCLEQTASARNYFWMVKGYKG